MMDLNQLWCDKSWEQPVSKSSPCGLIFQSEEVEKLLPADLMHPETDVKDTNQESSSRTDHTHDQHMSLPSHDQEMPKGFPTPMPQPPTASFDGVQESTPGSTSTVLQHVEHCHTRPTIHTIHTQHTIPHPHHTTGGEGDSTTPPPRHRGGGGQCWVPR